MEIPLPPPLRSVGLGSRGRGGGGALGLELELVLLQPEAIDHIGAGREDPRFLQHLRSVDETHLDLILGIDLELRNLLLIEVDLVNVPDELVHRTLDQGDPGIDDIPPDLDGARLIPESPRGGIRPSLVTEDRDGDLGIAPLEELPILRRSGSLGSPLESDL
jgi:hypothetical protein